MADAGNLKSPSDTTKCVKSLKNNDFRNTQRYQFPLNIIHFGNKMVTRIVIH